MFKVKRIIFISIFFILVVFKCPLVAAEEANNLQQVDKYKAWTIKFNDSIAFEDVNKDQITLKTSNGNLVSDLNVELGNDKKSLVVKAPTPGYKNGETYKLDVGKNVIKNKVLLSPNTVSFTVKSSNQSNDNKIDGTTYYVSNEGNDKEEGTISKPFRNIQYAVNIMKPGDTLVIRGGVYNEKINIANKNGSDNKWFTIKAYPGERVTLDGKDSIDEGITFYKACYWNIEGLEIIKYTNVGIYLRSGCHHFNMNNLKIWDLDYPTYIAYGVEGILGEGYTSYCTVSNCEIYNVGLVLDKPKDHGIYIGYGASNWTFLNNYIHDNSGAGIQMYGEPSGGSNCVIKGNNLSNNHQWGLVLGGNANNNSITGNQFYGNKDCDVYILNSSRSNSFYNNRFGSRGATYNIGIGDDASTNNTFDYNVYEKSDNRCIFFAHWTINFDQWKGYYQEQHGRFIN